MNTAKYKELILESIDQLRKRKARPDLERICHMLERRHGLTATDVERELERLVEEEIVIKVDYKGSTSYRNAAKWSKTRSYLTGQVLNSSDKFKKTHGPDFVEYSDLSCDAYRDSEELRCDYCQMTAVTNRKGEAEELLVCKDCNAKAHPSCMDYSPELAARSRMSPWQCIDCKTCALCNDSGDGDSMLFCDACDKGYHMECHRPKITEKPTGKWVCSRCINEVKGYRLGLRDPPDSSTEKLVENRSASFSKPRAAEVDTTGLPTPCDSPAPDDETSPNNMRFSTGFEESAIQNYPNDVPDATYWTIDDVEKFFSCVGFPEQAPSFREQEIDGKSLLLMKRSDVLTGLSIKLGPAVKIYNHVKRLQTGLPDGHLLY